VGQTAVLDAIRVVWASLWSDAALLYRQELALDPILSRMAVVVQEVVDENRSGVAFGRDPRDLSLDHAIVEAVPGPCGDLVDGLVDPDRWILDRDSGKVLEWRPGEREPGGATPPILEPTDLSQVLDMLRRVESLFRWPPDTEWTGQEDRFTLLQARPITTAAAEAGDERRWYLSLRPSRQRLNALARQVSQQLIPELEELGERLASEAIEMYRDRQLAEAIEERVSALEKWRQIYLDEFIPFAHGVRQLGTYYNDAVQPDDPYEFVGLLKGEQMVATRRNEMLQDLAHWVRRSPALQEALHRAVDLGWQTALPEVSATPGGPEFEQAFEELRAGAMDVTYGSERLSDQPEVLIVTVLEMAKAPDAAPRTEATRLTANASIQELERRLFAAVGEERREEAMEVLATGRLSWRLRDDDNLLLGRVESQLLRALKVAADRLRKAGRLDDGAYIDIPAAAALADALRHPLGGSVSLPERKQDRAASQGEGDELPRQLIGQPASPGLASGKVRTIRNTEDLGRFRAGEVLVCDAIQPTMTHLVPLACAIVERRGGMLIHGAIIARELGIPCVNGVAGAAELLPGGEAVTVDGYLGIVTVGLPEFDLEGVP
jgi:pyruvate,water dikinase